jgi:heat shock protein HslJ
MVAHLLFRTVLASALALSAQAVSGPRPLEGTYWKAVELEGKPVPSQNASREAYLLLKDESRVSGFDGCNRIAGRWQVKRSAITFSEMAATQMACLDTAGLDAAFRSALTSATELRIVGERLELFGGWSKTRLFGRFRKRRVAVFEAVSSRPVDSVDPEKH